MNNLLRARCTCGTRSFEGWVHASGSGCTHGCDGLGHGKCCLIIGVLTSVTLAFVSTAVVVIHSPSAASPGGQHAKIDRLGPPTWASAARTRGVPCRATSHVRANECVRESAAARLRDTANKGPEAIGNGEGVKVAAKEAFRSTGPSLAQAAEPDARAHVPMSIRFLAAPMSPVPQPE